MLGPVTSLFRCEEKTAILEELLGWRSCVMKKCLSVKKCLKKLCLWSAWSLSDEEFRDSSNLWGGILIWTFAAGKRAQQSTGHLRSSGCSYWRTPCAPLSQTFLQKEVLWHRFASFPKMSHEKSSLKSPGEEEENCCRAEFACLFSTSDYIYDGATNHCSYDLFGVQIPVECQFCPSWSSDAISYKSSRTSSQPSHFGFQWLHATCCFAFSLPGHKLIFYAFCEMTLFMGWLWFLASDLSKETIKVTCKSLITPSVVTSY